MNPLLKDVFAQARLLIDLAAQKQLKIGTAESCTGGLVGAALTAIPGASQVFMGGIIAYDNDIKMRCLGVPGDALETHGAVSESVACAMAEGALKALRLDAAVSITGIAGPGGGSPEKPVGTVWIGAAIKISGAENVIAKARLYEFGDIGRNKIRDHSCLEALKYLHSMIA